MGNIWDGHAVEPLIAALGVSAWETRRAVTQALVKLANVQDLEPLLNVLNNDNDPWTRGGATEVFLGLFQRGHAFALQSAKVVIETGTNSPSVNAAARTIIEDERKRLELSAARRVLAAKRAQGRSTGICPECGEPRVIVDLGDGKWGAYPACQRCGFDYMETF